MDKQNFDAFAKKYVTRRSRTEEKAQDNVRTKSTNPGVLELYAFLLDNDYVDSDFWTVGRGNDECIYLLACMFELSDWEDLKSDVVFWTNWQLETLIFALLDGDGGFGLMVVGNEAFRGYRSFSGEIFRYDKALEVSIIRQRISMILRLLAIGTARGNRYNDIGLVFWENTYFFKETAADIPYELMHEIAEKVCYYEALEKGWNHRDRDAMENIAYTLKHAKR